MPLKESQGGHFVSRKNKGLIDGTYLIIHPNNVHPQCAYCNDRLDGNMAEYLPRMIDVYGQKEVDRLKAAKLPKDHVWNYYELAEIKVNLLDEIKVHENRLCCIC